MISDYSLKTDRKRRFNCKPLLGGDLDSEISKWSRSPSLPSADAPSLNIMHHALSPFFPLLLQRTDACLTDLLYLQQVLPRRLKLTVSYSHSLRQASATCQCKLHAHQLNQPRVSLACLMCLTISKTRSRTPESTLPPFVSIALLASLGSRTDQARRGRGTQGGSAKALSSQISTAYSHFDCHQ